MPSIFSSGSGVKHTDGTIIRLTFVLNHAQPRRYHNVSGVMQHADSATWYDSGVGPAVSIQADRESLAEKP